MTVDQLPLRWQQCFRLLDDAWRCLSVQDAADVNELTKKTAEKRPRTAYALFVRESAAKFTAAHPGLSIGERSKLTAAEWKKVPQEVKEG